MTITRRQFSVATVGAMAASLLVRDASAETYPSRPVRLVVTFPPGGANDIIARLLGQALSERLGQQFVIDNRVGGGGNIGAEAVVRATPDGYTLLQATAANATNASLYESLNFNFVRDIAPVAGLYGVPLALVANPDFPPKTVPELIAYARDNPGKISHGSGGVGTVSHIAAEMFKQLSGTSMTHVPYRGSPAALSDLIAGRIETLFDPLPSSLEYIKDGRLRALAVTTAQRSGSLPDVPTIGEFLPGCEANIWVGIGAPRATPPELILKLQNEIAAVLASDTFKVRLNDIGASTLPLNATEFGRLMADETTRWAKVIKLANIKAD
jgi:tripartite-type tricarboxylate transporter receptor subunit TctC